MLANQTLQSLRVEHINAPEADTAKRLLQGGAAERRPLVSGAWPRPCATRASQWVVRGGQRPAAGRQQRGFGSCTLNAMTDRSAERPCPPGAPGGSARSAASTP